MSGQRRFYWRKVLVRMHRHRVNGRNCSKIRNPFCCTVWRIKQLTSSACSSSTALSSIRPTLKVKCLPSSKRGYIAADAEGFTTLPSLQQLPNHRWHGITRRREEGHEGEHIITDGIRAPYSSVEQESPDSSSSCQRRSQRVFGASLQCNF